MANPYNLESEMEAGGPEDSDLEDIEENEAQSRGNNRGGYPARPHQHAYRDESPYCSCGKNLDA